MDHPLPFLNQPPPAPALCLTCPLIFNFFQTLKSLYSPFVTGGGMGRAQTMSKVYFGV